MDSMLKKVLSVIGCCWLLLAMGCASPLQLGRSDKEPSDEKRRQAMQYFIKAKVFEAQRNYLGAIVALRSAADLDPTSPTIFGQLAHNYRQIEDPRMAVFFARKGLRLDPQRTDLRRMLIQLLERSGEREAAVDELEELLKEESYNWRLYQHLAYLYMEAGEIEKVGPLFQQLLQREDLPVDVKVDVANMLSRVGKQERAEQIYAEILKEQSDNEDAWLGLAELLLAQGKRDEAIVCYRQAGRALPESSAVPYYLARMMVMPNDLEEIIETEDAGFLYRLGVALSEAGKYEQATLLFERIVGMQPTTVEGWLDLARYYIYLEDVDQANDILSQASGAMPDSSDIYLFWGTALEQVGRLDEAIEIYRQGLQHLPNESDLYLYWGLVLEEQEREEEAIGVYQQGLQQKKDASDLWVRWGVVLARQEKWTEAIDHFGQALALNPMQVDALLHWGLVLEEQEKWEEAVEKLTQAVSLDETDTQVLFHLGAGLEQASRQTGVEEYFARAVAAFKQLLEFDPEDRYALNYLGYMYADKGIELETAIELLLKAVQLDPNNSAFFDSLGWAYFRQGDLDRAAHYLDRALECIIDEEYDAEEQAVIFDHAGDIAQAMGKKLEARQHWQKALQLAPDNGVVKAKLSP